MTKLYLLYPVYIPTLISLLILCLLHKSTSIRRKYSFSFFAALNLGFIALMFSLGFYQASASLSSEYNELFLIPIWPSIGLWFGFIGGLLLTKANSNTKKVRPYIRNIYSSLFSLVLMASIFTTTWYYYSKIITYQAESNQDPQLLDTIYNSWAHNLNEKVAVHLAQNKNIPNQLVSNILNSSNIEAKLELLKNQSVNCHQLMEKVEKKLFNSSNNQFEKALSAKCN